MFIAYDVQIEQTPGQKVLSTIRFAEIVNRLNERRYRTASDSERDKGASRSYCIEIFSIVESWSRSLPLAVLYGLTRTL